MKIEFFVEGDPKQRGSKSYMGKSRRTGKAIMVDSCKGSKEWMNIIHEQAKIRMQEAGYEYASFTKPRLDCTFYLQISKSRMRGKDKVEHMSPHRQVPDRDKLLRALQDALTGVVYPDDAKVDSGETSKKWVDTSLHPAGVLVIITQMSE